MQEKITTILKQVKNPSTGKSLFDEDRFVTLDLKEDGNLFFKYNRDGIDDSAKKQIEANIISSLQGTLETDKICLVTVTQTPEPKNQKPASLEAGHGPADFQKKRVPGIKKVIGVSSGKGGVGKSTVSVNLALSLVKKGKKVGLLDADIYGPSLPMLLGQRNTKPTSSDGKRILPIEAHGIKFISFGLFISESDPVVWRGPMLGGVINQFLFDVEWGELDYLIIDLPPGTGDVQLSLIQKTEVDGVLVVSTPQNVALLDSKKGLEMFRKVQTPILGMIENMSYFAPEDSDKKYFIFGEGGVEKAAKELKTDFIGGIPLEISLRESSDNGEPYMSDETNKDKEAYKAYMAISEKVDNILNGKKSFLGKLFN